MCSATNFAKLSSEDKKNIFSRYDAVLADCDGVLWIGNNTIPGADTVMNGLKDQGKKTYFITNNSTRTQSGYIEKFSKLGFKVSMDDIVGTAWLTAHYLKTRDFKKKVYLVGSKAVQKELADVGITAIGLGADVVPKAAGPGDLDIGTLDDEVGAVVVAYDIHFSVPKMIKACTYACRPGNLFIATNSDERFPNNVNLVWPGTGTMVTAIETAVGRKGILMGKPSEYLVELMLKDFKLDPKRCLMIGDRCNTDIYFGNRCGMDTLLVMTGVTSLEDLQEFQSDEKSSHLVPTYYTSSIADILPAIS